MLARVSSTAPASHSAVEVVHSGRASAPLSEILVSRNQSIPVLTAMRTTRTSAPTGHLAPGSGVGDVDGVRGGLVHGPTPFLWRGGAPGAACR